MASNTGAASIIIFFTISLLFTSIVTSWVLFNAYGVQISPIQLTNFYTNGGLDLTDTTGATDGNVVYEGGAWNFVAGMGLTSTSENSYILFNNAGSPNAGAHENSYHIDNPTGADYSIVLTHSAFRTQEIVVSDDGFHLTDSVLNLELFDNSNEVYFAPYEGANKLTDVNIRTVYDGSASDLIDTSGQSNVLEVYVNENPVMVIGASEVILGMQLEPFIKAYYGGIGSKNNIGLTVKSFSTTASEAAKNAADIASMGLNYVWTILKIIVWNIDSRYLPNEINLVLIKSQAFCIGIGVWFWIRG